MKQEEIPYYANTSLLLRTLTLKSQFKFGPTPELTVQEYLDLKKERDLIQMYYNLGKINFNTEILEILKICPEDQIPKPGRLPFQEAKDKIYEVYGRHLDNKGVFALLNEYNKSKKKIKSGFLISRIKNNLKYNKGALARKNHGH